jgi:molybdopterin-guanine dinucleotide biosynthesis protein
MKLVCIGGALSNIGKTTLAERLLSYLHGWAACKVTVCTEGTSHKCPRGKVDCGVCTSLEGDYELIENTEILEQWGKDTWRYHQAGAEKVIWVKTKAAFLEQSVNQAITKLREYNGIVFEGNHALEVLDPDIAVLLVSDPPRYKASAKKILHKVDVQGTINDPDLVPSILQAVGETIQR